MLHVISSIWPDGVKVDWVQGRPGDTTLVWSSTYIPIPSRSIRSAFLSTRYGAYPSDSTAILTMGKDLPMGKETVMAQTDGSLQIQVPDDKFPGKKLLWNRQYYLVPLEVSLPLSCLTPPARCLVPCVLKKRLPQFPVVLFPSAFRMCLSMC